MNKKHQNITQTSTNLHKPTSHQRKCITRKQNNFPTRQQPRIYNRATNQFSYNITYQTTTQPTPRSLIVAEAFGLGIDETQTFTILSTQVKITPTDITLITGDSGSGKSVLLKAIKNDLGDQAIELSEIQINPEKPLIETIGKTVEEALELLCKVGLNDAFLFLRTYNQLSDGQKFRYKTAKLIESNKPWWLIDEFCACLDRDTAKIITYNLQKTARQHKKALIVATTHNDLKTDLNPNVHIHKRYGQEIKIQHHKNPKTKPCSLTKQMKITPATIKDWQKLSNFHYRGHKTAIPRKIYKLTRKNELCGIIVYSYPPPKCYGRNQKLPNMTMQQINQQLSIINRIVIHPKYRSIGLGTKLIHDTLPMVGTPYIEMIAVMAKYSPFAEKAGMQKITQQQPAKTTINITKTLTQLGFNPQLLSSQNYVQQKLQTLKPKQTQQLKTAFIKNNHPRLKKELTNTKGQPYGKTTEYTNNIQNANTQTLTKLIKLTAQLQQTKIYLLWNKENQPNK